MIAKATHPTEHANAITATGISISLSPSIRQTMAANATQNATIPAIQTEPPHAAINARSLIVSLQSKKITENMPAIRSAAVAKQLQPAIGLSSAKKYPPAEDETIMEDPYKTNPKLIANAFIRTFI